MGESEGVVHSFAWGGRREVRCTVGGERLVGG